MPLEPKVLFADQPTFTFVFDYGYQSAGIDSGEVALGSYLPHELGLLVSQ